MKKGWKVVNKVTEDIIVHSLEIADGFWSRFVGLQCRYTLHSDIGLLLVPCKSVHTFMMCFNLDLIMLNSRGEVVAIARNVPPWKIVQAAPETYAVLELISGGAGVLKEGDRLILRPSSKTAESRPPASVSFLLGD